MSGFLNNSQVTRGGTRGELLNQSPSVEKRTFLASSDAATRLRSAPPPLPRQPSILDLVTAMPLLLSLDRGDDDVLSLDTAEQSVAADGVSHDAYGDAATAAVVAVLRRAGGPSSCQAKHRCRLRRAALDAFFRASLPAQIAARVRAAAASRSSSSSSSSSAAAAEVVTGGLSDGVHYATMRLLHHTRAVMAEVSPTQAHLVDLFADEILRCTCGSGGVAVTATAKRGVGGSRSPEISNQVGEKRWNKRKEAPTKGEVMGDAALSEEAVGSSTLPRSIMKTTTRWPAAGVEEADTATAMSKQESAAACHSQSSSTSVAEQLLYIILRTSIAAKTPLRWDGDEEAASECGCLRTPPSQAAGLPDQLLTPSLTNSASSTGSLVRKKPHLDILEDVSGTQAKKNAGPKSPVSAFCEDPAALFRREEEESIRHHHPAKAANTEGAATGGAVLPYEPRCWLGASTVALVERSETLQRQQRWTCERDPVVEATIAGEGVGLYCNYSSSNSNSRTVVGADLSLLGRRSHWAPMADAAANTADAEAFASIARDSGLPFAVPFSCASHASQEAGALGPSNAGVLHWALEDDEQGRGADPAVQSLFFTNGKTDKGTTRAVTVADSATTDAKFKAKSEPSAAPPFLPACRTPFVSCKALYDSVVYAHVYVALHRCAAGLVDPFELTYYETQGGPNLVEIRVRPELYAATASPPVASTKKPYQQQSARPHSGLTSMLEWGCRCGTLFLRLHRLCAAAEDATLRASLGNYGRCAIDTLQLLLCFLQRQIWELGERAGGWHRLSLTELLTAQQRLQTAAEQVEALAAFFMLPCTSAATPGLAEASSTQEAVVAVASSRSKAKPVPPTWDPVHVLQQHCCSAQLVSRLYQLFTARHANALGQHGSVAAAYAELQRESAEAELSAPETPHRNGPGADNDTAAASVAATHAREQLRKDLLSRSIDAVGLLLSATLRPFNVMLHRWLTTGELADPYDEFFVVPSHGRTHSGFTLDLTPQRLPVFVSAAAASDLLHAGVSLRVLRAAATHVARSAQRDARRLQALAEMTEAAAEDYAEELHDTQTLQVAIEKFIERLVRGAPTAESANVMGRLFRGTDGATAWREEEGSAEEDLPLPPRVDVLSAYGSINWWRQHYQACTQVLLHAVEEAAGEGTELPQDEVEGANAVEVQTADGAAKSHLPSEPDVTSAGGGQNEEKPHTSFSAAEGGAAAVNGSSGCSSSPPSPSSFGLRSANKAALARASVAAVQSVEEGGNGNGSGSVVPAQTTPDFSLSAPAHLSYPASLVPVTASVPKEKGNAEEAEELPYITVFINSDDDDDDAGIRVHNANVVEHTSTGQRAHRKDAIPLYSSSSSPSLPARSSSPSPASSTAASSVLGLHHIAGSKLSVGTTISSTASSRGTMALYGAITEELRQVSLLQQATEAQAGQSRHALRAEFQAQMWRRRRELRLADWKAQRLALRLRRMRATEGMVEELREVYGIRGAGYADEQQQQQAPLPPVLPVSKAGKSDEEAEGAESEKVAVFATPPANAFRFVVPLRHLPPPAARPPVVLYAEEEEEDLCDRERVGRGRSALRGRERPRRTSFAATATVVELPSQASLPLPPPLTPQHRRSFSSGMPPVHPSGILVPPRAARTRSASGPGFSLTTLPTTRTSALQQGEQVVRNEEEEEKGTKEKPCGPPPRGNATTDRRSRSSPASPHTAVDSLRGAAQQRGGVDGEAAADTSASQVASSASGRSRHAGDSGLAADLLALSHNEEQAGTVTLQEQWLRAAALPSISSATGDGGVDARQDTVSETDEQVRRDELGYAHHAHNYIVADINDDEFFLLRTGPKSYTRREAEAAALERLAAGRAALDRCTVDAPDFLEQLQHAAAAHAEELNRDDLVDREKEDEEEEQAKPTRFSDTRTLFLPSTLSRAWREDDPQDCLRRCDDADDENHDDCTRRLWAWTPAEAHRWYFDYRVPLHRVLTDSEVDHTLLVDLPLTSEEAEALQCCGGYYRELGQYTASFLTHKALQLTLLPPYGALYRLTTQFLDVCLLQNPAAAVRIVDVWIASVDAALEMMAEREEAAMVTAAVAGATHAPATLASLTDQQQGMDLKAALASLNVAFQREWAACVLNGDSTVTLEWKLKDEGKERKTCGDGSRGYGVGWRSTPASPRLGATQLTAEEDDAWTNEGQLDFFSPLSSDDDEDAAVDGAAPFRGWHHGGDLQQSDPKQVNREGDDHADDVRGVEAESGRHQRKTQQRDACTRDKEGSPLPSSFSLSSSSLSRSQASVIQSFLASLELTAVSPWCSGAWLLPDRTLKCLGGICRNLLFWKSAERVMLHMWRAGMNSGLSSAFFFCTTVRQVLLSTLQESLWARLTELTAAYRERLRFEAGVLYTYRALENFTVDHEAFLQDCEFYTLCAAPFQCRVQPLLRAMMREVEVAERALRFAQVSTRVARRQYMATFYFMVGASSSSSSSSSDSEDVDEKRNRSAAFSTAVRPKHKPASTKAGAAPHKQPHLFTPSRWCRRSARSSASQPQQATQQRSSTPSYLRPLEDALARQQVTGKEPQPQQRQDAEKTGKELYCEEGTEEAAPIPCKRAMGKQKSKSPSSSVTTQSTHSTSGGLGGVRRRHGTHVTPSGTRSTSALSSSTTTTVTATTQTNTATATCATSEDDGARGSDDSDGADAGNYSDKDRRTESSSSSGRSSSRNNEEEAKEGASSTKTPADVAATATADAKHTKKKKRRRRTAPAGAPSKKAPPRRSIMESATMNTTPIYAAILVAQEQRRQQQQQAQTREKTSVQKRGRSVGVGVRVPAAASSSLPHQAAGYTSAPAMKRHRDQPQLPFGQGRRRRRRGGPQEPQLTPEEQQERREKLRVIAERKIREETEHQRRLMRDVIARRMRRFAALTELLRDALSNIIAKEDVLTQEPLTLYPATESKLNNSCGSSAAAVTAAAAKEPHNAQLQRLRRFTYLSSMVRRLDSLIEVMASQV